MSNDQHPRSGGALDGADVDVPLPPEPTEPEPPRRRSGGRRWLVIAALFLSVALFGGGVVAGWRLFDLTVSRRALPEPSVVTVPEATAGVRRITMPDVRGLSEQNARQVLADAGVGVGPTMATRPWAGSAGLVVEQTPVFGTESPGAVTLTLSVAATVPTTDGREALDVAREVTALGAQVELQRTYEPGTEPGRVVSIAPPVGSPLPVDVTIIEAQAAESRFLGEVKALQGGCSTQEVRISGPVYAHGLLCRERTSDESVWLLSRAVDSITGQLGVPDTADPGSRARVEILVDGKIALTSAVAYGDPPTAVDLTTTGALRLVVRVTNTSGLSTTEIALGDVRLVGDATALQSLEQR